MKKNIKCFGAKILNRMGILRGYISHKKSIRILMYHRVNNNSDCLGLTVSPELFSLQLQFIKDNYEVISLADAVRITASGALTSNYCVITFDDGYRDNYEIAAPLLGEHSVPATIFVTYDAIETGQFGWGSFDRTLLTTLAEQIDLNQWDAGKYEIADQSSREHAIITLHRFLKTLPDAEKQAIISHVVATYSAEIATERTMMTWSEVRELAAGELITIGAHTMTHPILTRITEKQARYEIVVAKKMLEEKIERQVDFFAYPNGGREDISQDVVALVKGAGYHAACTTIFGQNLPNADPWELKRVDIFNAMSTDSNNRFSHDLFAFSLSGLFRRS